MNWHYVKNGQQNGPVDIRVLQVMYSSGQLAPNDLVWTDGMNQWLMACNIPAITGGYQAPPASPIAQSGAPFPGYFDPAGFHRPVNSGKAIASLVLGLISVCTFFCFGILLSIIGFIFGAMAIHEINGKPHLGGKGMAVAGVILSCIGAVAGVIFFFYAFTHPSAFR